VFPQYCPQPFGSLFQFHFPQCRGDLSSLLPRGSLALLGVDRLEHLSHQFHLGTGYCGEHIAVKMDCATLVFGLGIDLTCRFQHALALICKRQTGSFQRWLNTS